VALVLALLAASVLGGAGASASVQAKQAELRTAGTSTTRFLRHRRARESGISLTPTKSKPYWACPESLCGAIVDPVSMTSSHRWRSPGGGPLLEGSGELGGYDPADLQSAYKIPSAGGSTQTVALVDAYKDETAESDLAKYRERYGLQACTNAGGCFRKVNQSGEEKNYPTETSKGWEGETSLDLDMVSAACPHCHILLVQATTASVANLAESVNTAVALGATEVSNSYGIPEQECGTGHCESFLSAYHHAGVVIAASSGDSGYNNHYEVNSKHEREASPSFPATSPFVLAVGGTSLRKATGARGWSEAVWNEPSRELGTGSGCSLSEAKPSWQTDKGCTKRTDNDVAAVAACETPLSVYSTAYAGWEDFCGTSASAPFVTAILAHAGAHTRSLGADAFYEDRAALFGVTAGSNGTCAVEYLCSAEKQESGYDGPIGLGTPDGLPSAPPAVTGISPRTGLTAGGSKVTVSGSHFEEVVAVKFGTTPATGVEVLSETELKATAPAGTGTVDVTVETPAGTSATGSVDRFTYFRTYSYSTRYGAYGRTGAHFLGPDGLAVDPAGHLWVADIGNARVQELEEGGTYMGQIGQTPTGEEACAGALCYPMGVAIDASGHVWVADTNRNRIEEYEPSGTLVRQCGSLGSGNGQFSYPEALAVDSAGNVWVADSGNNRVQELSSECVYERQFGSTGFANGQFIAPFGIAVAAGGTVYVSDSGNCRVEKFSSSGTYEGKFGTCGSGNGQFGFWVAGLAVDKEGHVFAADSGNARVQEFSEAGEYLAKYGNRGVGAGQLENPWGVAVDGKGQLWITDIFNESVQKWVPSP
jgi:sugar lactone lactonase YvrE